MDFATPLLVGSLYIGGDKLSTRAALRRPGTRELMPMHDGLRVGVQAAGFVGADLLAQKSGKKWAPWVVRGAQVIYVGYVIRKNSRAGR